MKETVKERAILQEKITEGRINGKNAMYGVLTLTSLKDIEVVRSMEYLLPQVGRNGCDNGKEQT